MLPPSLSVRARSERSMWTEQTMAQLYGFLEQQVRRRPARWEEWHLFPRWLDRTAQPFAPLPPGKVSGRPSQRVLQLAYPLLYPVTSNGETHIIDVKSLASLGKDPAMVELLEAAERGLRVETWLQAHMAFPEQLELLKAWVAQGVVHMTEPGKLA